MTEMEVFLLAILSVSVVLNLAGLVVGGWLLSTGRIGTHRVYDPFGA